MMTRNQFLGSLGAGFMLFACAAKADPEPTGDDDDDDDDTSEPTDDDDAMATPDAALPDGTPRACTTPMAMIGANHGHMIVVPAAHVLDRQERTYDITGNSQHPHAVTVTPAMFAMIEGGQTVTITSSTDAGHSHQVTVTC